jgi:hypothetical protein
MNSLIFFHLQIIINDEQNETKTYSVESSAHNAFKWGYLVCFVLTTLYVGLNYHNSKHVYFELEKNTPQTIKCASNAYSTSFYKKNHDMCTILNVYIHF